MLNELLKVVFSLSVSGSVLIALLLLCRPLFRNRLSRQWQYYIWLVVTARLLLPFTIAESPVGRLFQEKNAAGIPQTPTLSEKAADGSDLDDIAIWGKARLQQSGEKNGSEVYVLSGFAQTAKRYLGIVWLGIVLALLIRKITLYQSFVCYVRAGREEVSDIELLDCLAEVGGQIGVRKPVELFVNRQVFSPLLIGFFRICIVLPDAGLSREEFRYTVLHELTHYKRRDMLYKWLIQLTVCLHWFNPLVWLMSREVSRACELSCDEAVIRTLDAAGRRAYGDTLLHAMETGGGCKNSLASVTLGESAELLKERLGAIMRFQKKSKGVAVCSAVLAGVLTIGAVAVGAYTGTFPVDAVKGTTTHTDISDYQEIDVSGAADGVSGVRSSIDFSGYREVDVSGELENGGRTSEVVKKNRYSGSLADYYAAGSLPLFKAAFARADEASRKEWLGKIYADSNLAFFSAAAGELDSDDPLLASYAEKAYTDEKIAVFSILADCLDEDALEAWLARALQDKKTAFQSVLFQALDQDEELQKMEEELEKQRAEAYAACGITIDGKSYYYQGKRVHIFLDRQPNQAFYTLDINPEGTVNVKIIRSADGEITGAAYMSDAEAAELFADLYEPDTADVPAAAE